MDTGPSNPATDRAVSTHPLIAATCAVPNTSAIYGGIVEKPPPYIVMIRERHVTKRTRFPDQPMTGSAAYATQPTPRNTPKAVCAPTTSDTDAHNRRPA